MERDLELIRAILLAMESLPYTGDPVRVDVEGHWDKQTVQYHVQLLIDRGFITTEDLSTFAGEDVRPIRITWAGHEFLDAARDDRRWRKVLGTIRKAGRGITVEIVDELLKADIRGAVGLGG